MSFTLGVRREDKNKWERRVPLTPQHLKELKEEQGIDAIIQTSPIMRGRPVRCGNDNNAIFAEVIPAF